MAGRQSVVDRVMGQGSGVPEWRAHAARQDDTSLQVRQEVISRLRRQVAAGAYHPPTDELVDRLVGLILARQAGRRPEATE